MYGEWGLQESGLWEHTNTIRNLKWAWALLPEKAEAISLLSKLDALSQKSLKQETKRSTTIYSVLWNTHCHIQTHSSIFVGGSAGRVECGFYKFFWCNLFMLCEVTDGLRHFKCLQSQYSSRITVCSVRRFNRTNWDNFTLVYLRHSENIFPWEVGEVVQVLLRVNLERHRHMRTIKAKDKRYSTFFFSLVFLNKRFEDYFCQRTPIMYGLTEKKEVVLLPFGNSFEDISILGVLQTKILFYYFRWL